MTRVPLLWSVAGHDSGGAAGLSADARAAAALGVHLCPVVAAVTAQNSVAVQAVQALAPAQLEAQLDALDADQPAAVLKTGMLGSAENLHALARRVDAIRARRPLVLVVDPVLRASSGAPLADEALVQAYREALLPRADVLTPNADEARRLLGAQAEGLTVPALGDALQALGATSVAVTGGDGAGPEALDWLATPQARGWLAGTRVHTPHGHGSGCSFASAWAAARVLGFVDADAAVLAKMLCHDALTRAYAVGAGPGPLAPSPAFARNPAALPRLGWGDTPPPPLEPGPPPRRASPARLYAIAADAAQLAALVDAGADWVQLRIKRDPGVAPDAGLVEAVRDAVQRCTRAGAQLFVNDHWELALELGARGLHLGQEDLAALSDAEREQLRGADLALGISSHSLWELCRAAAMQPAYIACGPVWPTLTKRMPWRPQGLHNLAWWCQVAPAPVVAIGGVLTPHQAEQAARAGAEAVCLVRAVSAAPARELPRYRRAVAAAKGAPAPSPEEPLPHPSLDGRPGANVQPRASCSIAA